MHKKERSAITSLGAIFSFRMLGLFMVLPVLSTYANQLHGATVVLIGLALGIYGLTQACLQIPFGLLSDRIGRKPIIAAGLLIFAAGSVVAALSHSIHGIILGRALQGAGAVGSATLALVADLTRDENRSKAMAFIGLTIGCSFTIAMVLGPMINAWFHLAGIFWLTAILALFGLLLLFIAVPNPTKHMVSSTVEVKPQRLKQILKNPQLLRLDLGIFSMHAMLTATFIAIPLLFNQVLHFSESEQIIIYIVVLLLAFITMVPLMIIAEKKRKMKSIFLGAITMLIFSQLLLFVFHHSAIAISILLFLFFSAFTLLEASLPSLVSKIAPIQSKGSAMGVYSTAQFFGIFIGGSFGGLIFAKGGLSAIFIFCAILGIIWLFCAVSMKQPPYLSTLIFTAPDDAKQQTDAWQQRIKQLPGIAEIALAPEEQLLYVKVDKKIFDEDELRKLIGQVNLAS